jgi:hypothetical protein
MRKPILLFTILLSIILMLPSLGFAQWVAVTREQKIEKDVKFTAIESITTTPFNQTKEDDGEWIHWDDGTNYTGIGYNGPAEFAIASRWEATDLADYDGFFIKQISFFPLEANATYSLRIWTGENHTQQYAQDVEAVIIGEWNTVEFETTLFQIDASDELMFGIYINATTGYPAGCDAGPAVGGKGDMLYDVDDGWVAMAVDYGLDYNWNLQAYVMEPAGPDTFNVTFNLQKGEEPNFDPVLDTIYITGSMFGWTVPGSDPDNQMLTRIEDTWIWTKTLQLQTGEYQYKYFLNHGWTGGEWDGDPNRVVIVEGDTEVNDYWPSHVWLITFVVTDIGLNPIEGAVIQIFDGSSVLEGQIETDEDGLAEIFVGCCEHSYIVTADGFEVFSGSFIPCCDPIIEVVLNPSNVVMDILSEIMIFPNPFKSSLTIKNASAIKGVTITNSIGQKMKEVTLDGVEQITIPTNGLEKGVYILMIEAKNGNRIVRKMVKE